MNLIILTPDDYLNDSVVVLRDRRHHHLQQVLKRTIGETVQVGLRDGLMGEGTLISQSDDETQLQVVLTQTPPPPLPVTLLLALPRPRMLARTLEHVTALGVKKLILMQTARVEKSYWQSPELRPEKINQHLLQGLEQARDTRWPSIQQVQRFKPFVEDELPTLSAGSRCLVAHPGMPTACPYALQEPVTLAIGPEGGFVPFEVDALQQQGFEGIHLGPRVLRVETAVTALLSRLF